MKNQLCGSVAETAVETVTETAIETALETGIEVAPETGIEVAPETGTMNFHDPPGPTRISRHKQRPSSN